MKHIILASGSPRRKELMELLPITFSVQTEEIEEIIDTNLKPSENVCRLASDKANAVAKKYVDEWVIGCDTVVVFREQILGKPKDEADAKKMLKMLSGNTHLVYTGVALVHTKEEKQLNCYVCSEVTMKALSDKEIDNYIATGEPMDKAGSYGIQGKAAIFVESIKGDYFNIVGLPVSRIYDLFKENQLISL